MRSQTIAVIRSNRSTLRRKWALFLAAATTIGSGLPAIAEPAQEIQVRCLNCETAPEDKSVDLLLRKDLTRAITLQWSADRDLALDGGTLQLYSGNPRLHDALSRAGDVTFELSKGHWVMNRTFSPQELGEGTFIAIMTRKRAFREEILDWRAFRLLTAEEQQRELEGPPPPSGFELTVVPSLIRAETARGALPRGQGGDRPSWWSLVDAGGQQTDLDLDGNATGSPGLGVQVSTPWVGGLDRSGLLQDLTDKITQVPGHTISMGEFSWVEQDERLISLYKDAQDSNIALRSYYTVITLYTNASVKTWDPGEVLEGGLKGLLHLPTFRRTPYYAHETSARLKQPHDPRFWASYDEREYSTDRRLLALLRDQLEPEDGVVPGLKGLQKEDGDGGSTGYQVAFRARITPWSTDPSSEKRIACLLGMDVVGSRVGHGVLTTTGSGAATELQRVMGQIFAKSSSAHSLDLDQPPEGFYTAPLLAQADTRVGSLISLTSQDTAQRDVEPEPSTESDSGVGRYRAPALEPKSSLQSDTATLLNGLVTAPRDHLPASELLRRLHLPTQADFSLGAALRAGALVQGRPSGPVENLVPINTFVQYVVRLTVAVPPEQELVSGGRLLPHSDDGGVTISTDAPPTFWDQFAGLRTWATWSMVLGTAFLVMLGMLMLPGLRALLPPPFSTVLNFLFRKKK